MNQRSNHKQMEQRIYNIWKKGELNRRLQKTFENSKSHVLSLCDGEEDEQ